jgi:hypothetical protein
MAKVHVELQLLLEEIQNDKELIAAGDEGAPAPAELVKRFNEALTYASPCVLEELKDELEEWYSNLPDNFQNGDKGDMLQEAIVELDGAIECVEEASNCELDEREPIAVQEFIGNIEDVLAKFDDLESIEPIFPGMFG